MKPKPNPAAKVAGLRHRAEERLKEQHPESGPARTDADTQRLVHELQVHQIELEMQNEELQQARDELAAGLEKYTDLYDFAPVGYLTLDREGTIRGANLTSATLLGIERSRLVTRCFGLLVAGDGLPAFTAFLTRVFASQARECCEVALLQEGKPPVEVRIEGAVAAAGQECEAVMTDITERNRIESARLILSKLESTGILAGGIAHDFNNLLTIILLDLELAQNLLPPGEEELAQRLAEAKQAALTARGLTQQLITFATGGAPVRQPTRLSRLIQESVRLALSGSRVQCDFSVADDLWLVEGDGGQLGQVFQNLILNAREAMRESGTITVRAGNVVLSSAGDAALPPGDYVRVSIADCGGGIAKAVLPKIFDPYFSTKQRGDQKGMGLGLTICHTVIQRHGGAITVESEVGVGTTFHLHLPAGRSLFVPEKTSGPTTPRRPGKILVMDDEEGVRMAVRALLRQMGHAVELVVDGEGAIAAYQNAKDQGCPFDVVLLDLTIRGGMGGQEAMEALLQFDPTVKAIVMSGYAHDPLVLEPKRYGFKGVLPKPFESRHLQELLARVMGSGPGHRAAP